MGLEPELDTVLKKLKVEAKDIKDPHIKLAILSLTKITEGLLKKINDLEKRLE